jgi:hypothetical protein
MDVLRVSFWSLCLACEPSAHTVRPGAGEVEIVASSTMGYGCVVPPFVVDGGDCGGDRDAYVLTTGASDPAQGPPGRYHLVGRWAEARSSFSAWAGARGETAGEGAPADDVEFRVLVVTDWCVERRSIPRAYREPSALAPASARWRQHVCA